jgi:TPR repeat protein
MKKTLLFALALIASGCADARQSALCEGPSEGSPLKDVRTCAEQGYAEAQVQLGYVYARGDGVPEDDAEALRWYRLAAEQGYANAQVTLGYVYARGEGVLEDDAEAIRWYRLAAEQGDMTAQLRLGFMYATGEAGDGGPEDDVLAYMWANLAAAQGSSAAPSVKNSIEERMTREQIAEAQRMSREWLEAHPPGAN